MMGYTEVIQVMGAMIIFSLVLTTANRHMLNNDVIKINSEVEVRAVSIAQDLIEFSKTVPFDQATIGNTIPDDIPDDFVSGDPVPTTTATNRQHINSFEDFNGFSEILDTNLGEFTLSSTIDYMNPADLNSTISSKSAYKLITVTVSNDSMRNNVTLSYVRVYNNIN